MAQIPTGETPLHSASVRGSKQETRARKGCPERVQKASKEQKGAGCDEEGNDLTGHSEQEEGGHQEMDGVSVQNLSTTFLQGFPGSSAGKECACNAGDPSSIPEWGRSAGEGIGDPLQYSWAFLWLRR